MFLKIISLLLFYKRSFDYPFIILEYSNNTLKASSTEQLQGNNLSFFFFAAIHRLRFNSTVIVRTMSTKNLVVIEKSFNMVINRVLCRILLIIIQ